ncbi:MAG: ABC transporter substrate-binding protein [Sphingomonas sp.]|nr:ABC transporter substrate-binding protein [Sphingomonas sp.]
MLAPAACRQPATGPVEVSAIGAPARLHNPNLEPLDPPSAFLLEAVAQGLVRFDANGEIEPALAQSWIVSDDGMRYTFRIRRTHWPNGRRVTAEQVAARLRAAISRASRNPFKPVLAAIDDIIAMTDEVLEIQLHGARPNFLQLLAQPELAIMLGGHGTGPYRVLPGGNAPARLMPIRDEGEPEDGDEEEQPAILLWGQRAAIAVTRFAEGEIEFVIGGTIGDLMIARAASLPRNTLMFDRPAGLLGLAFATADGPLADARVRRALAMAIDREAIAGALDAQGFDPRPALVPGGVTELPEPTAPDWADSPMPMRRELAARTIAALNLATPPMMRIAMPDAPGYRLLFAHLRRDWRRIGVDAVRVAPDAAADLRLVDMVAPANLGAWYLRQFSCEAGPVCDPRADEALARARAAATAEERRAALVEADRALAAITPYIALGSPVRWSLVSRRLTGFRPNQFARHPASELIAEEF